jgi:hypothetical protein
MALIVFHIKFNALQLFIVFLFLINEKCKLPARASRSISMFIDYERPSVRADVSYIGSVDLLNFKK